MIIKKLIIQPGLIPDVLNDYLLWDLIFQPFPEDFALIKIKIIEKYC